MNESNLRILQATKNALTGDFRGAMKSLLSPDFGQQLPAGIYQGDILDVVQYRGNVPGLNDSSWVASIDGNGYNYFRYTGLTDATKAYMKCPPLNSIINRKASAYINGKTYVMNAQGKEATTKQAKQLRALFEKPNVLQSWEEFEAQNYIYQQIYGYCIVLVVKPAGYHEAIDASSLWNIPPSMVVIEETKKLFYQTDQTGIIASITIDYKGEKTPLPLEDVFIIKDFTPSFSTMILPASRIVALEMPVNNTIGAYESRNVLINYRGALGVISRDPGAGEMGTLPMTQEEKDALQQDFKRYGLRNRQIQFIITKAAIKWQQMGYPTKDLMLFEEVEADTQAMCDSYGYPFRLLSSNSSNSLGGTDAGIFGRNLYQDTTIPESCRIYSQWERLFKTADYGLFIQKDYSDVAVLQEDKVQAGAARFRLNQALLIEWQNNMITWNEWQVELGKDPKPNMDIYYTDMVKQGKIFGAAPVSPVDQGANEQQTNNPATAPAPAA